MKLRHLLFLLTASVLISTTSMHAQTPQSIPYQSVARNTAGNLLSNQNLSIRFTIHQATTAGAILYRETHSVTTNSLGLFTALIGQGTPVTGTLAGINWGSGAKFLQVEMDASGGTNYINMGTTQMTSVPYALYAETANVPGVAGPAGTNGKTVLNGTANPTIGNGVDGDFYINTTTKQLFGPKASGAWGSGTSLIGPAGATGSQGIQGATGPQGVQGLTGAAGPVGPQGIQGTTGLQGIQGLTGAAGSNGKTILNGTANPTTLVGVDGDFYINKLTNQIFGPKASGSWGLGTSLIGSTGATGPQGPAGTLSPGTNIGNTTYWNGSQWLLNNNFLFNNGARIGIGTNSPAARLHVADSSVVFTGPSILPVSPAAPPLEGSGARMMWYPDKAAFRVGSLTFSSGSFWNRDSIGEYSVAMGIGAKATGDAAIAIGAFAESRGNAAISMGQTTKAFGLTSTAMGSFTTANGWSSTAMGDFSKAIGYASTAMGTSTDANGDISTAMGLNSAANGFASLVIGQNNDSIVAAQSSMQPTTPLFIIGNGAAINNRKNAMVVRNDGRLGLGTNTPAARLHVADSNVVFTGPSTLPTSPAAPPFEGAGTRMMWYPDKAAFRVGSLTFSSGSFWNRDSIGEYSVAMGIGAKATGDAAIAIGAFAESRGNAAISMGQTTKAFGLTSTAMGSFTTANGWSSTAMGDFSKAIGYASTAMGTSTDANGDISTTMGLNSAANGFASLVIGQNNDSIVAAQSSMQPTTPLFIIGNGAAINNRKNAMVVRNDGRLGLGTNTPAARLHVADSNVVFTGPSTLPTSPAAPPFEGAGTRMMWYPDKAAFRVGATDGSNWKMDSIGQYSVAMGYSSKAKGIMSTALGEGTHANGISSTAMGINSRANDVASTSMGIATMANGYASTSIGFASIANGTASMAIGQYNDPIIDELNTTQAAIPLFIIGNGTGLGLTPRSNVLVARDDGRVGIGTNNPGYRLQVNNSNPAADGFLEGIMIENTNVNTGEAAISFRNKAMDSTRQWMMGVNQNPSLAFAYGSTYLGSNTRLCIDTLGNVGIGTITPTFQLQLSTNSAAKPTSSTWNISSDARLKTIDGKYDKGLSEILKLNTIAYHYKKDNARNLPTDEQGVGFVAQDVQQVFPEAVKENADGYLSIDLHPVLVSYINAFKELHAKSLQQDTKIELLEKQNEMLLKRLDALEKK